jgi:beta-lactamase class A
VRTGKQSALGALVTLAAVTALALVSAAGARTPAGRSGPSRRCLLSGTARTIDGLWRPDMAAAIGFARGRSGDIAFAVRTARRFYGYRPDHPEWSASVVKAMLLVAYLDQSSVAGRALRPDERDVLGPMIRASDNDDAQEIFDDVGQDGLAQLARRVGMTRFTTNPIWGETSITARDQTRFFLHIDGYVAARHRSYAMRLLRSIIPSERWGVGELAPRGWKLYFKGGWGYGTGLLDHQVALLTRGCARVAIAVLTMYDGSHAYGKATLRGIFARLLRRFPAG